MGKLYIVYCIDHIKTRAVVHATRKTHEKAVEIADKLYKKHLVPFFITTSEDNDE